MIALDTNVFVRYVVDDGSAEARLTRERLPALASSTPAFFVSLIVLCETAWVLRSLFAYRRGEVLDFIGKLLRDPVFSVEQMPLASAALAACQKSRADYPDALIGELALAAGCERLLTFDRAMKGLAGVEVWGE